MEAFLQNDTVLVILSISAGGVILLLFSRFARGKISFSKEKGIQIDATGNSLKNKEKCPTCISSKDVIEMMYLHEELRDRINEIKHIYLPRELRNTMDVALNIFSQTLLDTYFELLRKKGFTQVNLSETKEYYYFEMILRIIGTKVLVEVERMGRENGFIKKEERGEWNSYVKGKVRHLVDIFNKTIGKWYHLDVPSAKEVQKACKTLFIDDSESRALKVIEEAVHQFLNISKAWYAEIDDCKRIMKESVDHVVGS